MSKVTPRGNILFSKIIEWSFFIILALIFLFAPALRVEWSEPNSIVEENYYADFSVLEWMFDGTATVHSKGLENLEDLFGITQEINAEDIHRVDGKINSAFESITDIGILAVMFAIFIPTAALIKSHIKTASKISSETPLKELSPRQRKAYLYARLGVSADYVLPICLPAILTALYLITVAPGLYNTNFSISLYAPTMIISIVLGVLYIIARQPFLKRATAGIIELNIKEKAKLRSMPYFGTVTPTTPTEQTAPQEPIASTPTSDQLIEYKKLLDAGVITQEEFDKAKSALFNSTSTNTEK